MRGRKPALSEAEGDPTLVDTQQRPTREPPEILTPRLSTRARCRADRSVRPSDEMTLSAGENASVPKA
jgi:hypothetical protein